MTEGIPKNMPPRPAPAPADTPVTPDSDVIDVSVAELDAVPVAPADELVKARWVDVQLVFVPGQGEISYGDPIMVTAEQLATGAHPTIPWADDWTPDPTLLAQSRLLEPTPKDN